MMTYAENQLHEAAALMERINLRLLDRQLIRMRLRRRNGIQMERQVLDDQALSRLQPDISG